MPDEQDEIAAAIVELCEGADLVLTSGGTGLAPRDVTPEATRSVIDREAPGIAEAMRAETVQFQRLAWLSRARRRHARPDARHQPPRQPEGRPRSASTS